MFQRNLGVTGLNQVRFWLQDFRGLYCQRARSASWRAAIPTLLWHGTLSLAESIQVSHVLWTILWTSWCTSSSGYSKMFSEMAYSVSQKRQHHLGFLSDLWFASQKLFVVTVTESNQSVVAVFIKFTLKNFTKMPTLLSNENKKTNCKPNSMIHFF